MSFNIMRTTDHEPIVVKKSSDPGSFTLPCYIGDRHIDSALADFDASVSVIPYALFKRFDLPTLRPTMMHI